MLILIVLFLSIVFFPNRRLTGILGVKKLLRKLAKGTSPFFYRVRMLKFMDQWIHDEYPQSCSIFFFMFPLILFLHILFLTWVLHLQLDIVRATGKISHLCSWFMLFRIMMYCLGWFSILCSKSVRTNPLLMQTLLRWFWSQMTQNGFWFIVESINYKLPQ